MEQGIGRVGMRKIGELIEVAPIRTVIQLSDLTDSGLKRLIAESFVLTDELYGHLFTILRALQEGQGGGFFILGSYGSGKSHFLSILYLLLKEEWVWPYLIRQRPALKRFYQELRQRDYLVVSQTLVEHHSREPLEDILNAGLSHSLRRDYGLDPLSIRQDQYRSDLRLILKERYGQELVSFVHRHGLPDPEVLFEPEQLPLLEALVAELDLPYRIRPSRQQVFSQLERLLGQLKIAGIVILLDELSEFLRSKPDGRSFNEDVRFLQFLGEWSDRHPLWIVASLQERLESTGEIPQQVFNKIKDRYARSIHLSTRHLEGLIQQRLVKKKPGAYGEIVRVYKELKSAFSSWGVSQERFYRLYPLHPQTLRFLGRLGFLFSQHRGLVDFIYHQLQGDPARRIKGLLDEPADTLLTPERIFDHFLPQLRERIETNSYVEVVYRYYLEEGRGLFPEPKEYRLALRVIKLLILQAIQPWRQRMNLRELAESLLFQVTTWESGANYQYVREICERLCRQGAYVNKETGSTWLEDIYYLDLEADVNLLISRRANHIEGGLDREDLRIFYRLASTVDSPQVPLAWLCREERHRREVRWQGTLRWGYVILRDFRELTLEFLQGLGEEFMRSELDFVVILGLPLQVQEQQEHLLNDILPYLRSPEMGGLAENLPLLFWLPAGPTEDELAKLRRLYAYLTLREEATRDSDPLAQKMGRQLDLLIADHQRWVKGLLSDLYYEGTLISPLLDQERSLGEFGRWAFGRLLEEVVSPLLDRRYPRHRQIAPRGGVFLWGTGQELISNFLRPGQIVFPPGTAGPIRALIEGYLRPLRIIKNIPEGFQLVIDPRKSPIVSHYLGLLEGGRRPLEEVYWGIRKGPYGLCLDQFNLLTLALIFSGQVIPYRGSQPRPLEEITTLELAQISHIGPGELLPLEQLERLLTSPLISGRWKRVPLTLQQQEAFWESLRQLKREGLDETDRLRVIIESLRSHPTLGRLDWAEIEDLIRRYRDALGVIEESSSAREGLEHLLQHQADLAAGDWLDGYHRVRDFLLHKLEDYLHLYSYLNAGCWRHLPKERFSRLAHRHADLIRRLEETGRIFEEGYLEELFRLFDSFKEDYIRLYMAEHAKDCSPEGLTRHQQLRSSPLYRLLGLLAQLEGVSVENPLERVEQLLSKVANYRCSALDPHTLHRYPLCPCGYYLGQPREGWEVSELEGIMQAGIREYIEALRRDPLYQEGLWVQVRRLQDRGEKRLAASLRMLLEVDLDTPGILFHLSRQIDPDTIQSINEVLRPLTSPVLIRDLDELCVQLANKVLSERELRQVFQQWLCGTDRIAENTRIRVIRRGREEG